MSSSERDRRANRSESQRRVTAARAEDQVLRAAENLDPADNSREAEQLRETAEDIQDRRSQ